jgi:toxin ParE1/3/4
MDKVNNLPQMVHILWSENARNNLKEIVLYLKKYSLEAPLILIKDLKKKIYRLETHPDSGRHLPEFPDLPFREIIIGNYRMIYEHRKNNIEILTIIHAKRLLKKHLRSGSADH